METISTSTNGGFKGTSLILLIVLCLLGAGNLFKLFTFDKHLKESKEFLKEAQNEIENAKSLNSEAQGEIQKLRTSLEKYELKNEKLQLEIDSISLAKKAKAPKDWEERQNIKRKQEEITSRLDYLRQKDKEFE